MSRLKTFVTFLMGLLFVIPAIAQEAAPESPPPYQGPWPTEFSSLWVEDGAVVAPEAVAATIDNLRKQQPDPQQIVVLVHGFDVPRESSTVSFDAVAKRLKAQFAKTGTRAAIVGLQWHSAAETSIFGLESAYFGKIPVARSIGRGPMRRLLFAIQEAFPKAQVNIMAHSMGCELSAAAVLPEMQYVDNPPFVETYRPDQAVSLNMAVLAGSDLDYDIWTTAKAIAQEKPRVKLAWATIAPYLGEGDEAMNLRARVRGVGGGAAFPKMTTDQMEVVLGQRRFIFDGKNIPHDHALVEYYNDERLARVLPAVLYMAGQSKTKPPEIAEVDEILAAPADADVLAPYLDSDSYGSMLYTLWRLEKVNCGDARHLADGTIRDMGLLLRDKPQMVWKKMARSECVTMKKEQFPSEAMLTKAGAPAWARKK